jgi:hypothetical protein
MLHPIALASRCVLLAGSVFLAASSPAFAECGQPLSEGGGPKVRDCIYIARASLGVVPCSDCVCDTDGSANQSVGDALRCLWHVVGAEVTLDCPTCESSTTTTEPGCAACGEAFFHTAAEEDLCESSRLLFEAMMDCPCTECAEDCGGLCDTDSTTTHVCPHCIFDSCRQAVADCLDD